MDWKQVKYDAIVVGSGATGGTAARWLTQGGANVLLLEAGPRLPAESCGPTEKSLEEFNALKIRQPVQSQNLLYDRKNCHLFVDDLSNPYTTESGTTFNWIRSRQAGGRTLVWSRIALRMSEQDLSPAATEERPETGWPVQYRDLAPYYDQIETLAGITGTVESIPSLPDGRFLPRRISPYLGVLRENLINRFPHRYLLPSREVVDHQGGRAAPPSSSSLGSMLLHAAHERLTFRTNCVVARIELDRPDHAKRVVFVDRSDQRWYDVTGRVIVLCASALESTRILLASVQLFAGFFHTYVNSLNSRIDTDPINKATKVRPHTVFLDTSRRSTRSTSSMPTSRTRSALSGSRYRASRSRSSTHAPTSVEQTDRKSRCDGRQYLRVTNR